MRMIIDQAFEYVSPLQGLFFYRSCLLQIPTYRQAGFAALPLIKAAEQRNICNQLFNKWFQSCRAAQH